MTKAGSTEKVVGEIRRHTRRRFSRLGPDARFHTVQAMRANWFIGRALNRNPNAFSAGEEGFHEPAAGLFMVGYDLRDA